jgi:hypothetical protein
MKKLEQNGFSLVEIMIAGGLLCALAMGYMKFMDQQNRVDKGRRASIEVDALYLEIRGYLAKSGSCTKSFEDANLKDSPSITSIKKPNGNDKYIINKLYGNRLVKIKKMVIRSFDYDSEETTRGIGTFEVQFEKQGKIVGGKHIRKEISLDMLLDEDQYILECATVGNLTISLDLDDSENSEDNEDRNSSNNSTGNDSTTNSSSSSTESNESSTTNTNSNTDSKSSTTTQVKNYLTGGKVTEDNKKKLDAMINSNPELKQLQESIKSLQQTNSNMIKQINEMD